MKNITVRNIPDEVVRRIRELSTLERRSLNGEILVLLEKSVCEVLHSLRKGRNVGIEPETQIALWESICGRWQDSRTTEEIVADIRSHRTKGREVSL